MTEPETEPPPLSGGMRIRSARAEDACQVQAIVERAYHGYVGRIGRRPAPMGDDYAAKNSAGTVFVAERDRIRGLIVLVPASGYLLIENVAVEPEQQGLGLGRLLLRYAEEHARARNLPELRPYTNAAMTENLALYPKLGFRVTGRKSHDGFERVFFAKRVD